MSAAAWILVGLLVLVAALAVQDLVQRRHAVRRNFPVIGRFRHWLELVGPELRQYIVTSNNDERPFSRDERRWVYASAKHETNTFGFGTDNEMEEVGDYVIVKQAEFALDTPAPGSVAADNRIPVPKVVGGARDRRLAFRPASVVNISGMSFGALSPPAVEALNRGAALCGCLQNTGEGGVAPAHRYGGELVFQLGTGYFGCRDDAGAFSLERLLETLSGAPVRALEIKLSQGAKPGLGGFLPAAKVTPQIAAMRGVPAGVDCLSPPRHSAFSSADELLDFAEQLGSETGLPVGIKSAVGEDRFWSELAELMHRGDRGLDFITIDGGEGGTGSGRLAFTDHVALPFKIGFARVYRAFAERGIADRVVFVGSGKLGLPAAALTAFALGCDMVGVGREAMLAVGCIQAQRCHTGRCPTGVATQSKWLMRGLDPDLKAARVANYVTALRADLLALARSCGVSHPALVEPDMLEVLDGKFDAQTLRALFGYEPGWSAATKERRADVDRLMA